MANEIRLGVFRRLDNRLEGLDDQSPRALELHTRRKRAARISESICKPFPDPLEEGDELWSGRAFAQLRQCSYKHRRVGSGESFFSLSAQRVERRRLTHLADFPHTFTLHGSGALERVEVKAHGVVGQTKAIGEIVDGPSPLPQ